MTRLRVLIADDELLARRRLHRLLQAMDDVEIAGECEDGAEVLVRAAAGGVDVVLLDIQMPGLTGLDAMQLMPAGGPRVVFCTAHAEHAVDAFAGDAVDYLLKPIEPQRLRRALERVRVRLAGPPAGAEAHDGPTLRAERLAVSTPKGILLVDPATVTHAVLEGVLVTLYTTDGEYLSEYTLKELAERLPAGRFERVHRNALLNLDHVERLEPQDDGGYVARTRRGHAIEVSRRAARELRRRLGLRS